jgi:hypothetical protein
MTEKLRNAFWKTGDFSLCVLKIYYIVKNFRYIGLLYPRTTPRSWIITTCKSVATLRVRHGFKGLRLGLRKLYESSRSNKQDVVDVCQPSNKYWTAVSNSKCKVSHIYLPLPSILICTFCSLPCGSLIFYFVFVFCFVCINFCLSVSGSKLGSYLPPSLLSFTLLSIWQTL